MTIYISGGSNSMMRMGWAPAFENAHPPGKVHNVTIGGACSITGIYRLMFTETLRPGDTVIWEYALNDVNFVNAKSLQIGYVLKYLEILLTHCAQRGVKVAGLILVPRNFEVRRFDSRYVAALMRLLTRWQVPWVNISHRYRAELGVRVLPPACFRDIAHYQPGHPIIDFITAQVVDLADAATVPVPTRRKYAAPRDGVAVIDSFDGGTSEIAGTSWYSGQCWNPGDGMTHRMTQDATLVCALVLAHVAPSGFDLSDRHRTARISATITEVNGNRRRLCPVFFDRRAGGTLSFRAGDLLRVRWPNGDAPEIGATHSLPVTGQALPGRRARIYGFLLNVRDGLGAETA